MQQIKAPFVFITFNRDLIRRMQSSVSISLKDVIDKQDKDSLFLTKNSRFQIKNFSHSFNMEDGAGHETYEIEFLDPFLDIENNMFKGDLSDLFEKAREEVKDHEDLELKKSSERIGRNLVKAFTEPGSQLEADEGRKLTNVREVLESTLKPKGIQAVIIYGDSANTSTWAGPFLVTLNTVDFIVHQDIRNVKMVFVPNSHSLEPSVAERLSTKTIEELKNIAPTISTLVTVPLVVPTGINDEIDPSTGLIYGVDIHASIKNALIAYAKNLLPDNIEPIIALPDLYKIAQVEISNIINRYNTILDKKVDLRYVVLTHIFLLYGLVLSTKREGYNDAESFMANQKQFLPEANIELTDSILPLGRATRYRYLLTIGGPLEDKHDFLKPITTVLDKVIKYYALSNVSTDLKAYTENNVNIVNAWNSLFRAKEFLNTSNAEARKNQRRKPASAYYIIGDSALISLFLYGFIPNTIVGNPDRMTKVLETNVARLEDFSPFLDGAFLGQMDRIKRRNPVDIQFEEFDSKTVPVFVGNDYTDQITDMVGFVRSYDLQYDAAAMNSFLGYVEYEYNFISAYVQREVIDKEISKIIRDANKDKLIEVEKLAKTHQSLLPLLGKDEHAWLFKNVDSSYLAAAVSAYHNTKKGLAYKITQPFQQFHRGAEFAFYKNLADLTIRLTLKTTTMFHLSQKFFYNMRPCILKLQQQQAMGSVSEGDTAFGSFIEDPIKRYKAGFFSKTYTMFGFRHSISTTDASSEFVLITRPQNIETGKINESPSG